MAFPYSRDHGKTEGVQSTPAYRVSLTKRLVDFLTGLH